MTLFRITGYDDRHIASATWRDHPRGKCLFVCVGPHLWSHVFGRVVTEPAQRARRPAQPRPSARPFPSFLMACAAGIILVLVVFGIVVGIDVLAWRIP